MPGPESRSEDFGSPVLVPARADGPFDDERGPGTPFPPTFLYMLGFFAGWVLHQRFPLALDRSAADVARTVTGILLLALGTALFTWGMATFYRVRTGIMLQRRATEVVSAGPYRWSRNPQYVSFVAMYVGGALLVNSLWPLLLLPAVLGLLATIVIAREERYMRRTFGATYIDYCRRVPRWL